MNSRELAGLLDQHGLNLAAVGSGAGWLKHKLRLTDPDPAIRRAAVAFVAALIELAGPFGAPVIIGLMQGRSGDGVSREQAVDWLRQVLEELGAHSARHQTALLYEPLNRDETDLFTRVAQTREFLDSLRAQNVLLLLDLFHMNLEEPDLAAAVRLAGDKLGHVHFADSNRQAMGFGYTDMAPIARALRDIGYRGFVSAEILPLPDSDTAAKQAAASFRRWFAKL